MATALLVVSAISAVAGAVEQRKIGKAQRKQNRLTNKIASITRRRNVKRQIASSRIQVAQAQAAGFQIGVNAGTAVQGAVSGIVGDTATSIGQSNLQFTGQGFLADFSDDISRAQGSAATFGAISSLTGSIGSNPQAVAGLESFFGVGG